MSIKLQSQREKRVKWSESKVMLSFHRPVPAADETLINVENSICEIMIGIGASSSGFKSLTFDYSKY
jgi:hypothetical protein